MGSDAATTWWDARGRRTTGGYDPARSVGGEDAGAVALVRNCCQGCGAQFLRAVAGRSGEEVRRMISDPWFGVGDPPDELDHCVVGSVMGSYALDVAAMHVRDDDGTWEPSARPVPWVGTCEGTLAAIAHDLGAMRDGGPGPWRVERGGTGAGRAGMLATALALGLPAVDAHGARDRADLAEARDAVLAAARAVAAATGDLRDPDEAIGLVGDPAGTVTTGAFAGIDRLRRSTTGGRR